MPSASYTLPGNGVKWLTDGIEAVYREWKERVTSHPRTASAAYAVGCTLIVKSPVSVMAQEGSTLLQSMCEGTPLGRIASVAVFAFVVYLVVKGLINIGIAPDNMQSNGSGGGSRNTSQSGARKNIVKGGGCFLGASFISSAGPLLTFLNIDLSYCVDFGSIMMISAQDMLVALL